MIPEIFKCFFVHRKCGAEFKMFEIFIVLVCAGRIFCNELFLFGKNDSSPRPSGDFIAFIRPPGHRYHKGA